MERSNDAIRPSMLHDITQEERDTVRKVATLCGPERAVGTLRHGAHVPRHGRCMPVTRPRYCRGGGHDMAQCTP